MKKTIVLSESKLIQLIERIVKEATSKSNKSIPTTEKKINKPIPTTTKKIKK